MSKAIKKSKYRSPNSTTYTSAKAIRPPVLFEKRDQNRRRLVHPSHILPSKQRRSSRFLFQKKSTPVYVDKLFQKPVTEFVTKLQPSAKTMKLLDHQATTTTVPETSMEDENKGGEIAGTAADDMWESLGFASPQMQGIDERAEQFILTFRADMEIQEMIARGS